MRQREASVSKAMSALLPLCMLCVVCSRALAAPAQADDVERLFADWQVEEGALLLARLASSSPRHPRVQMLQGYLAFLRGDYEAALSRLRGATLKQRRQPRLRGIVELVESTAKTVRGYVEQRSPSGHFRVRVPRGKDEILVPFVFETLDAIRAALERDLGYAPKDSILVEIYPRAEDLARVSPLTVTEIQRTGTIALCKYNRLMIVSPRALLRGYPWRDTLAHEYVHLVVSRVSKNSVPIWLHEGLAKFFETRWRSAGDVGGTAPAPLTPVQEHLLATALAPGGRLVRWSDMHPSMAKLPSQEAASLAFAQVQTAIAFVSQRATMRGLRQLLEALRAGRTDWQALEQVTGLSADAFDQAWRRYLRALKPRKLGGLVPQRLRFRGRGTDREATLIAEAQARRYFRLADMLRQRQLTQAAIVEYKKARVLLGERDAIVGNALARAYLEVQAPAQAVRVLLPVLEYYPELAGPQVTLGSAYRRAGNATAAARHLNVALRINPFDPELHCELARVVTGPHAQRHARLCQSL